MRLLCAFAMLLLAVTPASAQVLTGIDVLERRSEEHTSELQSQSNLVCRLLLEKKQPAGRHDAQGAVHVAGHPAPPARGVRDLCPAPPGSEARRTTWVRASPLP